MSVSSNNSARRWADEFRAWRGLRWYQFRSWQTHGRDRRAWGGYWWHRLRSSLAYGRDRWAWDGFRWHRLRSWLTYSRTGKLVLASSVVLGSMALVGLLSMERGSAPALFGQASPRGAT